MGGTQLLPKLDSSASSQAQLLPMYTNDIVIRGISAYLLFVSRLAVWPCHALPWLAPLAAMKERNLGSFLHPLLVGSWADQPEQALGT
jgi:hypothetical protein